MDTWGILPSAALPDSEDLESEMEPYIFFGFKDSGYMTDYSPWVCGSAFYNEEFFAYEFPLDPYFYGLNNFKFQGYEGMDAEKNLVYSPAYKFKYRTWRQKKK